MFRLRLWISNTFTGFWINPLLFGEEFDTHKWWHFIFMGRNHVGWLHNDRPGYTNEYKEKTCSKCGFIKRTERFYKLRSCDV